MTFMNKQKTGIKLFRQSLFLLGLSVFAFSYGVDFVKAADFEVSFEATPLFLNADVKPGDSTTRSVTITNLETDNEAVYASPTNTFDTGLAPVMQLTVSDGTTEYFSGSFADFFANSPLALGSLAGGETVSYDFTASLPSDTGNAYQETQLGFDLVIGWDGGSVDDGNNNPGGTGGTGGTGGGGGGGTNLVIFNEELDSVGVLDGTALISWNTNRDATSYLVCGDTDTGTFTLDPDAAMFGYQFIVPEDTNLTSSHSLSTGELDPGNYECRPASREDTDDDFTVGDAILFTIPGGAVQGASTIEPNFINWEDIAEIVSGTFAQPTGSVLGANTGKGALGAPTYDEWRAEMDAERDRQESQIEESEASTSSANLAESTTENIDNNNQNEDSNNFNWLLIILGIMLAGLMVAYLKFRA
jgi:hypothetical protein